MKTFFSKFSVVVLLIVFVMQPVLQILLGIGNVEAASNVALKRYVTTNTMRTEEINAVINREKEDYKLIKTEYQYTVYYRVITPAKDILKDDLSYFKTGNRFGSTDSKNLSKVIIEDGGQQNKNVKEGFYWSNGVFKYTSKHTFNITLSGSYVSDWTTQKKTIDDFPMVKVWFHSNKFNIDGNMIPVRIQRENTRYTWEVTSKIQQLGSVSTLLGGGAYNKVIEDTKNSEKEHSFGETGNSTGSTTSKPSSGTTGGTTSKPSSGTTGGTTSKPSSGTTGSTTSKPSSGTTGSTTNNPSSSSSGNTSSKPTETMSQKVNKLNDSQKRLYIRALYKRVLGREPSNSEINIHFNGNVQNITIGIIFSTESKNKNKIDSMSNQDFVKACYTYIFGRTGDNAGIANHTNSLNKGTTRQNLVKSFVESQEFIIKTNKTTKTITMNKNLANACYTNLKNNKFSVIKPTDTSIVIYEDEISKVTSLDISGKEITDLSGLSIFTNLKTLLAQDNKISDISEISKLTKLEKLQLANNSITNISKITSLVNLKELNLNNCKIKDNISYIFNLTNLEKLYLSNNGISNSSSLNNIDKLSKLQVLVLDNNSITSLGNILKLSKLSNLSVNNNNISNVGNVGNSSISTISIKNNTVSLVGAAFEYELPEIFIKAKDSNNKLYTSDDIECVNCKIENNKIVINKDAKTATLTIKSGVAAGTKVTITNSIETVTLKDKVLADRVQKQLGNAIISRVDGNGKYILYIGKDNLKATQLLDLSKQPNESDVIKDISGLEKFENLKVLSLNNNKVSNLENLANFKKLNTLFIRHCELTDLNKIKDVTTLTQLDASNNYIKDLTGLSNLKNLECVILSSNNIGNNLKPLNSLNNVKILALSNNNINDISLLSNLNLNVLHLSYNSISDISKINNKDLEIFEVKNNSIDLKIESNQTNIPNILKYEITQGAGINNLECINCYIKDDKLILNSGHINGQVKIKSGNLGDTVVNITSIGDTTPPKLTVDYSLNNETGMMNVTVTANEDIQDVFGWERGYGRNVVYKSFKYNINNQYIIVKDIAGNETKQLIEFSNVKNSKIPGLTINYSNSMLTKDDVTVTISSAEELHQTTSTWKLSADKKSISRTFTENENRVIANVLTESMYNKQMMPENVEIQISNIDKEIVIDKVEYSETNNTKSSVIATIWANEKIVLGNQNNNKNFMNEVTKVDEQGNTKYGVQLYYADNVNQNIIVSDLANNSTTVRILITNIDTKIDGLYTSMNTTNVTNKSITLTVGANEKLQIITNENKQANINNEKLAFLSKIDLAKIASSIKEVTTKKDMLYKVAGDINIVPIMYGNVELVNAQSNVYLSENDINSNTLLAENIGDTELVLGEGNEVEYEISENGRGVIAIKDGVNNTDLLMVNAEVIDQNAPVLYREEDIVNNDGSITVTLKANEVIVKNESLVDWELGEDGMTLTKTFKLNKMETIQVQDLAGNTVSIDVDVDLISGINYEVWYETIDETNKVIAVIHTDRELVQLDGWLLTDDNKGLFRVFDIDEKVSVNIEDINGISQEVYIDYLGDKQIIQENDDIDNENSADDKQEDNTQSKEELPQTGKYSFISGTLIITIILLTIGVLVYDNKKINK